jgi:hypothetical protein
MKQASKQRVRYPNRTVYFGIQTGLIDEQDWAAKVEAARVERLNKYLNLTVESLEGFKQRFGIAA